MKKTNTRDKLIQKEIPFTKRKAVKLGAEDYKKYDYIIGMEKSNIINMAKKLMQEIAVIDYPQVA